ncbi:MAG: arginine--tRNA ligase [Armatimonadetes bacterium]|nr:arginine--tRNA ligase [Armatimonadota bacterium]
MIRDKLAAAVTKAIADAREAGEVNCAEIPEIALEPPKSREFGDFTTNIAMMMAREARMAPRRLAELVLARLSTADGLIERAEVAGGGYINLYLKPEWLHDTLIRIADEGEAYGRSEAGRGTKVQVEYVSANPNGPIHIAHGRGGAVGDVIANMLEAVGCDVTRESYINDARTSLQMQNFGRSVNARYMQALGHDFPLPDDAYRGEYVTDIARKIVEKDGEAHLSLSEDERVRLFTDLGEEMMLEEQKADLEKFGVKFDVWFSEQALHDTGKVQEAVERLKDRGYAYEKADALWLKSTEFGDDKDRTLVRSNGQPTYIAADAAYHADKLDRGFDRVIDVWGPDHHGYISRTKAAVAALGYDSDNIEIIIFQVVRLYSGGELVMMSKRAGDVVLLADLIEEVGRDAARFFFLMRSHDSGLDFDLELAKSQSNDNPVYYVQYAHARICSILRKALEEEGIRISRASETDLSVLRHESEIELMKKLGEFPDLVQMAAEAREPHRLTRYAQDLAAVFHGFYTDCRVISEDAALTAARLVLVDSARTVLANNLRLLGIGAPEKM